MSLCAKISLVVASVGLCLTPQGRSLAADAAGWRNGGDGHFPAAAPPTRWSKEENILWQTELPGQSHSSPIVAGGYVFVMCEPGDLLAVELDTGEIAWRRTHTYTDVFGPEKGAKIAQEHARAKELKAQADEIRKRVRDLRNEGAEKNDPRVVPLEDKIRQLESQIKDLHAYRPSPTGGPRNTTSTPVSDGKNVFAVTATGIVSSHTLAGKKNWMVHLPPPAGNHSASPLLVDGKLVVQLKGLHALDPATGKALWTAESRPRYGTPQAAKVKDQWLVATPEGEVYRADDGHRVADKLFRLSHCSPIESSGVVFALEDGGAKAVRLKADAPGETVWTDKQTRQRRLASPIVHGGLIYSATEKGILEVFDAAKGDLVYRQRLNFRRGRIDPSLCLAGGNLYISSNAGVTYVVKPGRKYQFVARNELEGTSSTPFFVDDKMIWRGRKMLYCVQAATASK